MTLRRRAGNRKIMVCDPPHSHRFCGAVVTTRGGDFDLWLGQDVSIGYLAHDVETVTLYLQESLTFQMQTSEAVVVLGA